MTQTQTPVDLVNDDIPTIMAKKGVGQRRAYQLQRRARANQRGSDDFPVYLKAAILLDLYNRPTFYAKEAADIAIPGRGVHEIVHVLWSLQKQGLVTFRESKRASNGSGSILERVRLTTAGIEMAMEAVEDIHIPKEQPVAQEPLLATTVTSSFGSTEAEVVEEPVLDQEVLDAAVLDAVREHPLDGLPNIQRIVTIAQKRDKVSMAATLLEEVGEADVALELLERMTLSSLEQEVVTLLRRLGVLEGA